MEDQPLWSPPGRPWFVPRRQTEDPLEATGHPRSVASPGGLPTRWVRSATPAAPSAKSIFLHLVPFWSCFVPVDCATPSPGRPPPPTHRGGVGLCSQAWAQWVLKGDPCYCYYRKSTDRILTKFQLTSFRRKIMPFPQNLKEKKNNLY